jgi:hypothetical protein
LRALLMDQLSIIRLLTRAAPFSDARGSVCCCSRHARCVF